MLSRITRPAYLVASAVPSTSSSASLRPTITKTNTPNNYYSYHYARLGLSTSSANNANNTNNDAGRDESGASNNNNNGSITSSKRPSRRRLLRRSNGGNDDGGVENIPSLADFMHRAKVRKQYRNFVRLAHFVDGTGGGNHVGGGGGSGSGSGGGRATGECRAALDEVRVSYKLGMKKATDSLSRNMAYSEGERRLRELQSMVGYTSHRQSSSTEQPHESYDDDSWINIKDEEDPRGRVGVQWPWEQSSNDESDASVGGEKK